MLGKCFHSIDLGLSTPLVPVSWFGSKVCSEVCGQEMEIILDHRGLRELCLRVSAGTLSYLPGSSS